ncbi:MAG: type II secretion system protein N [Rhodanobacter sp.]
MHKSSGRRRWRRLAFALLLLLAVVAVLIWFFPARWALAWLTPRLHGARFAQVSGTLWQGEAGELRLVDGRLLGSAQWQVSRRVLWSPQPLRLQVRGAEFAFDGTVQRNGDSVAWDQVHLRANLALWRPRQAPGLGLPRGEWDMQVDHAVLQAGWPLQAAWHARWSNAGLLTHGSSVTLGTIELRGSAQAGVIDAHAADDGGGPLQLVGNLRLTPLGWWLDARLRARADDPALHHWLATLGQPDADGAIHVHRVGGLAAMGAATPAPAASATVPAGTKDKR